MLKKAKHRATTVNHLDELEYLTRECLGWVPQVTLEYSFIYNPKILYKSPPSTMFVLFVCLFFMGR